MQHFRVRMTILLLLLVSLSLAACTGQTNSQSPAASSDAQTAPQLSESKDSSESARQEPSQPAIQAPDAPSVPPSTFSGKEAYKHVQQLASTIGARAAGTAEERAAADYIASYFSKLGYNVQQQPFEFDDYDVQASGLEIKTPSSESIRSLALAFSIGGDVTGPLKAAGLGNPADFSAGGFDRTIVLLERGTIRFSEKVANAAKAGAVGAIVYNNTEGDLLGNLGEASTIPIVGIKRADGERLLDLLKAGPLQMRLNVDAKNRRITSQNVIAKGGDTCRTVIGGHYDSVPAGPGANDNASGTASVMELARVARGQAQAKGLCFMAFGSEELGLWGSRRYVESLSDADKKSISLMINMDMVGVGDRWSIMGSQEPGKQVADIAQALGVAVTTSSQTGRGGGGSDHASFIQAGIPAVFFYRMEDPNYHTANDKAEFVDPTAMEEAGKMAASLLEKLPVAR